MVTLDLSIMNFMNLDFLFMFGIILIVMMISYIHPVIFSLFLILYAFFVCIFMGKFLGDYFFPLLLWMMFSGGVMILILYFTSLIGNDFSFKIVKYKLIILLVLIGLLLMFYFILVDYEWESIFNLDATGMKGLEGSKIDPSTCSSTFVVYLYIYPFYYLTLFMMFYLLMVLFLSVKICSSNYFPLRKFMS